MAVQGEGYFIMMAWMHLMCLLPAKCALHCPLRPGRAGLSIGLSSLYSLLSLLPGRPFGRLLCAACALIASGVIAFGRQWPGACLHQLKAGLCYAGACAVAEARGAGAVGCLALCGGICLFMCRQKNRAQRAVLRIAWRGNFCRLQCLYDTGNALRHPIFGTPVIVAGEARLKPLLPPEWGSETLPLGFSLVPVQTVQGRALLPAFRPDEIRQESTGRRISAFVALSPQPLPYALLPRDIFLKEEKGRWKKSEPYGSQTPPSVPG